MGEKLLAQRILTLLRSNHGRDGRVPKALLEWAEDERDWLWPGCAWLETSGAKGGRRSRARACETLDWDSLPGLTARIDIDEPEPMMLGCVEAIGALLELEPFDRAVFRIGAALNLLPRLDTLRRRVSRAGEDMVALTGRLAGADRAEAANRVRRSDPIALGFLVVD